MISTPNVGVQTVVMMVRVCTSFTSHLSLAKTAIFRRLAFRHRGTEQKQKKQGVRHATHLIDIMPQTENSRELAFQTHVGRNREITKASFADPCLEKEKIAQSGFAVSF